MEAVEIFLVGAGIVWGGRLVAEGDALGIVVEEPLVPGAVEGRLTATIVVEVGNTFGEWRRS